MTQPSSQEQYLLELVNRFRANPVAEYDFLVNSNDPEVERALTFFKVDRTVLANQFASLVAAQPLAWSEQLSDSATTHSQLMIDFDEQSHNLPGEPGLLDRINNAGPNSYIAVAENIYTETFSPLHTHAGFVVDWGKNVPNGIQNPAGHRNSLINNTFSEAGFALLAENDPATTVGPLVATQHLGDRNTGTAEWLLGVAFQDLDDNDFYSVGEGLGGVTVNIEGGGFNTSVLTNDAGGYQTLVPQGGLYQVEFVRGNGQTSEYSVAVGSENAKQDWLVEVGVAPTSGLGKIVGVQFDDVNNNGLQDTNELGIANRIVFLDNNNNRQLDVSEQIAVTDAEGLYIFNNVTPGNYALVPILPADRKQTAPRQFSPIGSETYQLDDGNSNGWAGFTSDTLVFNQFEAVPGQETLISISVGLSSRGNPTKLFIYQDADGDNTPDDDEKLLETSPTLTGTSGLANVAIAPTVVSGTFFVGALYAEEAPYTWIPRDDDAPDGKSWRASAADLNSFSASAYSSADWLLRANAVGVQAKFTTVEAGQTTNPVKLGDRPANLNTVTGTAADNNLKGRQGDDRLLGLDGDDRLTGRDGNDVLEGGNGRDRLYGSDGDDTLNGGMGDDFLSGQSGNDVLFGAEGDDTLFGIAGKDLLFGGQGNDRILGGGGNDILSGDEGDDVLNGGGGNDLMNGGDGADRLYGQAGDDTINGGAGNDLLFSGGGNDILNGQAGDDTLSGGNGNNTLNGGDGNDVLTGGVIGASSSTAQIDTLIGGAGNDVYVVQSIYDGLGNNDYALIQDFDTSDDVIELGSDTYSLAATSGALPSGMGIYDSSSDLLAIVEGYSAGELDINAAYFNSPS